MELISVLCILHGTYPNMWRHATNGREDPAESHFHYIWTLEGSCAKFVAVQHRAGLITEGIPVPHNTQNTQGAQQQLHGSNTKIADFHNRRNCHKSRRSNNKEWHTTAKLSNSWLEISNARSNAKLDTSMVHSNDTKSRLDIQQIHATPETKCIL